MVFSTGLRLPEGPVVLPDGSWLVVEMDRERGCVTHISRDGQTKRAVARTGRPNGLAVDKNGAIWVAESETQALLCLSLDGKIEVVATACDGDPFLWPNDLCFGPDGAVYLTDSGARRQELMLGPGHRRDYGSVNWDGRVYRVNPETGNVRKLDSGFCFTNGIAFGPDGYLYVNEMITSMVYRYRWCDGGGTGPREAFGNANPSPTADGFQGTDGMAFGADGKLYVALFGRGSIAAMNAEGAVVEHIPTLGRFPTNVAFGLPGEHRIFVTEDQLGQIEVFDVATGGLELYK
jgi:gluconolactonase